MIMSGGYRRPSPKSKILWKGFRLVRLHDNCSREAIRFFHSGLLIAIIQKNGNIALSHTGIFDNGNNVRAQLKVAQCLHGLKLVSNEFLQAHQKRADDDLRKFDMATVEHEADRLGFRLVPKKTNRKSA